VARTHQPCGTPAAYWRHRNHDEEPCPEDRDAVNTYQDAHRAALEQLGREFPARYDELAAARQDALLALRREQPGRFAVIFAERKAAAGV
jgi:hypothetical protein